jgi:hypothetical protein
MEIMNHLIFDRIIGISAIEKSFKQFSLTYTLLFYVYTTSNRIPIESRTFHIKPPHSRLNNLREANNEKDMFDFQIKYYEEYRKIWMENSHEAIPDHILRREAYIHNQAKRVSFQIQSFKAPEN